VSQYIGNVRFMAKEAGVETDFRADKLAVRSGSEGDYQSMFATGNPTRFMQISINGDASFSVEASEISLQQSPQILIAKGSAHFVQKMASGESVEIKAEHLKLTFSSQQVADVAAKGTPLIYQHIKQQSSGINATANKLRFDKNSEQLILSGQVTVVQGTNQLRAEKIFYDGRSGNVTVPHLPDQQVEIIQQPKEKQ